MTTRRSFLRHGALGLTGLAVAPPSGHRVRAAALFPSRLDVAPAVIEDPAVRALALRAVDAAKAAGAVYADVRLTRQIVQMFGIVSGKGSMPSRGQATAGGHETAMHFDDQIPWDSEELAVGVRALVGGCWGFAASPFWNPDEMPVLAAEAVRQAKANARVSPRRVELAPTPVVTGTWRPPGSVDPFTIPPEEKLDALRALLDYATAQSAPYGRGQEGAFMAQLEGTFIRRERALATSEGTYVTQATYASDLACLLYHEKYSPREPYKRWHYLPSEGFDGRGWERFDMARLRAQYDAAVAETFRPIPIPPIRPIEVGRYDVVCSAEVAAQLVNTMFGRPTELDRALGYEANAGGTSWLDAPLEMLGALEVGTPALTVTANRSALGQLATVGWDDEGVAPKDFPLVKDGVLSDFQTTRESASWLAPRYATLGRPVRSHGCAASASAFHGPALFPPNLALAPGKENVSLDDLIKDTKRGLAFFKASVSADFQGRTGVCVGAWEGEPRIPQVREIIDGKLGAAISATGLVFDASKLWKSLTALGGSSSRRAVAAENEKGQPRQAVGCTVTAVPLKFTNASVIDVSRRG